jgi:phosphoglycerate dehydrogenase-like enzyme
VPEDETIVSLAPGAEVLVSTDVPRSVIEAAPGLHAIVSSAIGYDRVDVAAATEHGILVCNSPSPENVNGVAEATIGLMIALTKGLTRKDRQMHDPGWGSPMDRGVLLWRRTVGIVGLGRIGRAVAARLAGWGVRVIAYAPTAPREEAERLGVEIVDLPVLLRTSDIVTPRVSMRPGNRHLVGAAELALMRPNAYLVNMARGEVVDTDALVDAVRAGRLAGVANDVYEEEPLPVDSPLRTLDPDRVILTPHTLSNSVESREGNLRALIENVLALARGEVQPTTVNPEVLPTCRGAAGRIDPTIG